ncbi:splicing factor, Prp19-binding domain-containing protein [Roridomyces roridus]|uniref:Splicing factor, Prp19-binding domain-containing protein n=1 Tax=Roridomyces roridus TaxID=1738132 RepID=A0AAD7BTE1_9AGAR|nr:splicing factor, Prp19-binding domain-containing protein [Roridomyces roridus]
MSTTTARKQAPRLAAPAVRYWKGKAPKGALEQADSDSEQEEEDAEDIVPEDDEEDEASRPPVPLAQKKSMNVALRDVNISTDGKVIVAGREESGRTLEEEEDESDGSEEEAGVKAESSSEEESDSEEEEKPKLQFRPVFVPKRGRVTIAERDAMDDSEEATQKREAEAEERRKQSHDLVAESIRRELAEKEKEDIIPDVDDTDGLEPEAEFEAWRLRELGRIKKEKEDEMRREEEREEVERRRALPEEQRMKEDLERAQKLRDEKPKGSQSFCKNTGTRVLSIRTPKSSKDTTLRKPPHLPVDVSLLPKVMQVKNFGKRSRTKYTHLLDQDTTVTTGGFGGTAPVKAGGTSTDAGGCFTCGGPHLKKGPLTSLAGSGANAAPTGPRRNWGAPPDSAIPTTQTPTLGVDSSSISIGNGQDTMRIDVPMRSFQGGYYPHLIALYQKLGIEFHRQDFSYSFSVLSGAHKQQMKTTLIYNGASGRNGVGLPSWLQDNLYRKGNSFVAQAFTLGLFILSAVQLFVCYMRLILFAIPPLRSQRWNALTFEQWAVETTPTGPIARWLGFDSVWRDFTQDLLIPLFSAVCTAPKEAINAHPVEEFLDYCWLTFGTHHYVVSKGVRDVVKHLTVQVKNLHLSSRVEDISIDQNDPRCVTIECSTKTGTTKHTGFHHIIFATQANRVGPMLSSYASSLPEGPTRHAVMAQLNCVEAFHYVRTIVINHTDDALAPPDERDRRDLNLVSSPAPSTTTTTTWSPHCVSPAYTMATHILDPPPALKAELSVSVYQTTNPFVEIREDRILSVATLERAVLTMTAKEALRGLYREARPRRWWETAAEAKGGLGPLQGGGSPQSPGIWLCGSYAYAGIPLLEGCVCSARNVYLQICEGEGVSPGPEVDF